MKLGPGLGVFAGSDVWCIISLAMPFLPSTETELNSVHLSPLYAAETLLEGNRKISFPPQMRSPGKGGTGGCGH